MIFFNKSKGIDPVKNKLSTELEVNKWSISEFVAKKLVPVVGMHPYPLDELMLMASMCCLVKPTHIVEWGTHIGKSARIFYETIKYFNIKCEILSFDLPDDVEHGEHPQSKRGMLVKRFKEVKLFQEDALVKGIQLFEDSKVLDKRILFFVDGDHEYTTVKMELATIFSKVPDAQVLLHDTFYQSEDSGYNIGPINAVREFLSGRNDLRVIHTNLGLPGMTFIGKII